MAYKWSPKQCDKDAANFMSMAAKLSDLADEMSGVNLQTEGHMDMPSQSVKDLWEPEALDSSPSHLPSWSSAQMLHPATPI